MGFIEVWPPCCPPEKSLVQVERVFAVESVEEAIDNLKGLSDPWAKVALQNTGILVCVGPSPAADG